MMVNLRCWCIKDEDGMYSDLMLIVWTVIWRGKVFAPFSSTTTLLNDWCKSAFLLQQSWCGAYSRRLYVVANRVVIKFTFYIFNINYFIYKSWPGYIYHASFVNLVYLGPINTIFSQHSLTNLCFNAIYRMLDIHLEYYWYFNNSYAIFQNVFIINTLQQPQNCSVELHKFHILPYFYVN